MPPRNRARSSAAYPAPGIPVDASGGATIDPTKNVLDLVRAAVERIDDMRDLQAQLTDEKIERMEASAIYAEKIAVLRAEHNREIRHMESDRVDKIRSVDVANAAATAAQLLSAVTTLATTAQATAETLRNQVAATAAAVASQTERVVNPIIERLALLEKSSNFGQGRAELANPAMTEAIVEMRKIATGVYERVGRDSVSDPALTATLASLASGQQAMAAAIGSLKNTDATAVGRQQQAVDSRQMLTWVIGIAVSLMLLYTFTQRPDPSLSLLQDELRQLRAQPQVTVPR